jgi:anti-sigma factor RsiW
MRGDRVIVGRMDEPRCREVVDRLSEFLDGELDRSAAESVALHLEACASCAQFARELAATILALHRLHARCGRRLDPPR